MGLVIVQVAGADGTKRNISVDEISVANVLPLHKVALGAIGVDDRPVSSANPMPVGVSDTGGGGPVFRPDEIRRDERKKLDVEVLALMMLGNAR